MPDEKDRVRSFFDVHADDYRKSESHRSGDDLAHLVEALDPNESDRVLDVATGTGNTALSFLPLVDQVWGVDLTPGMERAFTKEMEARRLSGARFVVGDAEALPFPDATFTVVTCRRAAHHFSDKPRALSEMIRVLQTGGRLGIVDMVAPPVEGAGELSDDLERLRDDSHVAQWSRDMWMEAVLVRGVEITHVEEEVEAIAWESWLFPVSWTPELEHLMRELIEHAPEAARKAVVSGSPDGPAGRRFLKHRMVLTGTKKRAQEP